MSRELIPDPSMSVAMATVSIVGVGDGWSSPCPGHRSSREGARNDDPRVVVANSSLNALGEVPEWQREPPRGIYRPRSTLRRLQHTRK